MFLKRMRLIHRNESERLSDLREQFRALTEEMVTALPERHLLDILNHVHYGTFSHVSRNKVQMARGKDCVLSRLR